MWHRFRNYFLTGLVALGPLYLTVMVVRYLIRLADASLVNPLFRMLPFQFDATIEVWVTKAAIAAVVVALVALTGFAAERLVFRRLYSSWERLLETIPIINKIYMAFKEIAKAFFRDKAGVFKRVVFIEYPRKGIWAMGFVTQDRAWEIGRRAGRPMVNVFVPSPPNPATGFFVCVPLDEVMDSDLTIEQAIRVVISGGAAVPGGAVPGALSR